ncbi:MAG TPA: helix-turn-helix domain-containing protein [archaeon]|nr:helix-turn-helix domain-containing protein [archaeon]
MPETTLEEKLLGYVGLSKGEAKVYLALIRMRTGLAGQIAQKIGMHRRNVYDSIERLVAKGLVSYVMHGTRRYFQAENPQRLIEIMNFKMEDLSAVVPKLEKQYGAVEAKQEARIYRGKRGLKTILDDQLNYKEILVLGGTTHFGEILKYYAPQYTMRRVKKKVLLKMIYGEKARGIKVPMAQWKFLPEKYLGPAATNIWGDKVAIIIWSEQPLVVMIESKEIADSYRHHFEFLWSVAEK